MHQASMDNSLQSLVIAMLAPATPQGWLQDRLAALTPDEWATIEGWADAHRLHPLLFDRLVEQRRFQLPAPIAAQWRRAARASTMHALLQQADIAATITHLRDAAIEGIALKGAFLAAVAYRQPGLRPLRDLDLWVPRGDALRAHAQLQDAGYTQPDPGDAAARALDHHQLPALLSPSGHLAVELHVRLFHGDTPNDPSQRADWANRARTISIADTPVRVPSPEDLLLHLVVHAAYDHRFDNGPLTLPDIAALCTAEPIDWERYHQLAAPYRRGSDLLLAMVEQGWPDSGARPLKTLTDIPDITPLMVQDPVLSDATKEAPPLVATLFPGKQRLALLYGRAPILAALGWPAHWWRLATRRLPQSLFARRSPEGRSLARLDRAYREWLEQK